MNMVRFLVGDTATGILHDAASQIEKNATERDIDEERSMKRTVEAFNALTGHDLTEVQGWLFMAVLKAARATAGEHQVDDYVDGAAYFALAGECGSRPKKERHDAPAHHSE